MARISDHPLRLARIKAGLSQSQLADRAGVNRSAVTAVEDGRTKMPGDKLLGTLAPLVGVSEDEFRREILAWNEQPLQPVLRPAAQNLLLIPPYTLGQYYKSFVQWRAEFAPSSTAFASMLRINPAIVRDYENGKLQKMPDGLSGKMMQAFGFDGEYLKAVEGLARG